MPQINIEYDNTKVKDEEIIKLSEAIQKIVSTLTEIKDVFVYGNSAHIKLNIAPIEIYIRMSASKISDPDKLFTGIKIHISNWKKEKDFPHPINLTLIPMHWKFETGI